MTSISPTTQGSKRARSPSLEPLPPSKFQKLSAETSDCPLPIAAAASSAAASALSSSSSSSSSFSASSSSSSAIIDDDDCKESHDDSLFPFYVKELPSIEDHEEEWLTKTGLTKADYAPIDKWVESQMPTLSTILPGKVSRYTKEETGLPRTIHVFTAFGKICVQVLCKTKGGLELVGSGYYKKGKISVEWRTKTLWVQYVGIREIQEIRNGLKVQNRLAGQPGIFPAACGCCFYKNKSGVEKFNFFGPLRDGNCESALPLLKTQIYSFAHQLLKILCILERANVIHIDIAKSNLLYRVDSNQKIHIELSDFDLAEIATNNLAEYRDSVQQDEHAFDDLLDDPIEAYSILTELDPEETLFSQSLLDNLERQSAQKSLAQFESEYAAHLTLNES